VIRTATDADRAAVIRMGLAFASETAYGELFTVTPAGIDRLFTLLENLGDRATIFVADDGDGPYAMIVLASAASPFNPAEHYADELCWWVDPRHRGGPAGRDLLIAACDWARTGGCKMLKMVEPAESRIGVLYRRLGFRKVETAYSLEF